jgi:DNA-directed RNA polymerase subunit beta'
LLISGISVLPNKIGYILGLPSKKLDMIIYYEKMLVKQVLLKMVEGESVQRLDFLTEEFEYLDTFLQTNILDDFDPNKFVAKMGAECIMDLLGRMILTELSYQLEAMLIMKRLNNVNRSIKKIAS